MELWGGDGSLSPRLTLKHFITSEAEQLEFQLWSKLFETTHTVMFLKSFLTLSSVLWGK